MIDFEEIAVLDRNALYWGVPTHELMENAGSALANIAKESRKKDLSSVAIFCGLGNNGGDGMVAARHLANLHSVYVRLYLLGDSSKIRTNLATEQYCRLPKNVEIVAIEDMKSKDIKKLDLSIFSVIIDAMLGVGITGKLREPYRSIVKQINSKPKPGKGKKVEVTAPTVISADVPTGLGTDLVVLPDITVTFHDSKIGMTKQNSGKIKITDIGIPVKAEQFVGPGELTFLPRLKRDNHKGDSGRLLIIGGGPYTGAPGLVGLSALRTGVDLVHIATPQSVSDIVASFSPNFIVHPLIKGSDRLTEMDVDQIIKLIKEISADAMVIGPGLGRAKETMNAINTLISKVPTKIPLVLDADTFSALAKSEDITKLLKTYKGILTPHTGEFKKLQKALLGDKKSKSRKIELEDSVKSFAHTLGSNWTVLLKSSTDIISDGTNIKLNKTGNPGMTVGGTGDVLAGITGALLAQGLSPFKAGRCAAFISGSAGDLAWERYGRGLMATDMIELIPECLKMNGFKLNG